MSIKYVLSNLDDLQILHQIDLIIFEPHNVKVIFYDSQSTVNLFDI